jgi:hypothetical protein
MGTALSPTSVGASRLAMALSKVRGIEQNRALLDRKSFPQASSTAKNRIEQG